MKAPWTLSVLCLAVSGCDSTPTWNRDDLPRSYTNCPIVRSYRPQVWNDVIVVAVDQVTKPVPGLLVVSRGSRGDDLRGDYFANDCFASHSDIRLGDLITHVGVMQPDGRIAWHPATIDRWPQEFRSRGRLDGVYGVRSQRANNECQWEFHEVVSVVRF